jgi:hypothetical protein
MQRTCQELDDELKKIKNETNYNNNYYNNSYNQNTCSSQHLMIYDSQPIIDSYHSKTDSIPDTQMETQFSQSIISKTRINITDLKEENARLLRDSQLSASMPTQTQSRRGRRPKNNSSAKRAASKVFKEPVVLVTENNNSSSSYVSRSKSSDPKISFQNETQTKMPASDVFVNFVDLDATQFIIPDTPVNLNESQNKFNSTEKDKYKKFLYSAPKKSKLTDLRVRLVEDFELIPLSEFPLNFWENLSNGRIDVEKIFADSFDF